MKRGFTKKRPARAALAELRGITCGKVRSPSVDEAATILRECLNERYNVRRRAGALLACFIHLAACCGLRMGEIRALDLDHLDLEGGTIRVRASMLMTGGIKGPKTKAGNRDVPVPEHLVGMLRQWIEKHHVENPRRLIFTTPTGKPPCHTDVHSRWIRYLSEIGLLAAADPLHFHGLRHFAGSWWLHTGMPVAAVSRLMGHANPAITMQVYAHALVSEQGMRAQVQAAATQIPGVGDATVTQRLLSA